jgi:hypothetical protein
MISIYNGQQICKRCGQLEIGLPDFKKAKEAEEQEVLNGNYAYSGIGFSDKNKIFLKFMTAAESFYREMKALGSLLDQGFDQYDMILSDQNSYPFEASVGETAEQIREWIEAISEIAKIDPDPIFEFEADNEEDECEEPTNLEELIKQLNEQFSRVTSSYSNIDLALEDFTDYTELAEKYPFIASFDELGIYQWREDSCEMLSEVK